MSAREATLVMSEDDRIEQAIAVLARPGTYEVLHALHTRSGAATFAQIAAVARQTPSLLRALAAERLLFSYHCGSLDIEPAAQTTFMLTAKGEAVAGHIIRLQHWITTRNTPQARQSST